MINHLTLSQFQQLLGNSIRLNRDIQNVWVQAEFSDMRIVGGHCYMELIEKDTAGTTRAKIRAMIWSGTLGALRRKFFDATGRDIGSGMKVLVRGSATHHNLYGLSFTISDIDPTYTLGDMERLRREILERLQREGIINRNKELRITPAPQRIAVISAAGAAGYGDFMNQIEHNPDGFAIYTMLFPAVMQGERTAPTVLEALDRVEMTREMWNAVVIIRGGGATTDLNGFDNYDIARRVATFPLPVIVGIGHERDRTVLDEIACVRCKTPTAAAAYIIDSLRAVYTTTTELVRRIAQYGAEALKGEHLRLSNVTQTIPAYAANTIMREQMRLTTLAQNIPARVNSGVMKQQLAINEFAGRLGRSSDAHIYNGENRLQRISMRLCSLAPQLVERESLRLKLADEKLRLLNPENTLKRGYSITRVNGKAVRCAEDVAAGSTVETTLYIGKLTSKTI